MSILYEFHTYDFTVYAAIAIGLHPEIQNSQKSSRFQIPFKISDNNFKTLENSNYFSLCFDLKSASYRRVSPCMHAYNILYSYCSCMAISTVRIL